MASFFKNMMNKFNKYDEDEYNYDDDVEVQSDADMSFSAIAMNDEVEQHDRQNMRVVDFRNNAGHQVVIVRPNHVEAAQTISRHIQAGRTVICNFENCEAFPPQRILDFVNGAAFALGGSVKAVSNNIFLVAPPNVSLMNNSERQESRGSYVRQA